VQNVAVINDLAMAKVDLIKDLANSPRPSLARIHLLDAQIPQQVQSRV
jgi:hypothetical protein